MASVEDAELCIFLAAGWVEAASKQDVAKNQVGESVLALCNQEGGGKNLNLIHEAVSKVGVRMALPKAKDRVKSLRRDYTEALRSAGFESLPETRLHIAVKHIRNRLKPPYLKRRMADIILWRKYEQIDKKRLQGVHENGCQEREAVTKRAKSAYGRARP